MTAFASPRKMKGSRLVRRKEGAKRCRAGHIRNSGPDACSAATDCWLPLRGLFHPSQFHMQTIAEMATMALTSGEERACFFRGFGLHAPLFQTRHCHGGVECF